MLPKIQDHASYQFRHLAGDNRDEAIHEVICNCCLAFARLVQQGRAEAATWSSLAKFAVAQIRDGRQVGNSLNIKDVTTSYCQKRNHIQVRNLHNWDEEDQVWREILGEDKTATPADLAASRIDFPAWLDTLNKRDRKIALKHSQGEETRRVAKLFRLSKSRASQLRRELWEAWQAFQRDLEMPVMEAIA
jgi:hypothetical protein